MARVAFVMDRAMRKSAFLAEASFRFLWDLDAQCPRSWQHARFPANETAK